MPFKIIWSSILLAALATLAACSSLQSPMQLIEQKLAELDTIAPQEYLTKEIPPCTPMAGSTVDPCQADVFITTAAGAVMSSVVGEPGSPPTPSPVPGRRITRHHIPYRNPGDVHPQDDPLRQ